MRKGQVHSEETKKRMAEAGRGNTNRRGAIHSDDAKRKMSVSGKAKVFSAEHKKHISEAGFGRVHSIATRKKMSESAKKRGGISRSIETRKRMSESRKKWSFSDEAKKNISKSLKGKPFTEEHLKNWFKSQKHLPNKSETFLMNLLDKLYPNEWKYVGDGQFFIAGKCPDFINVNGQKKIIELFGDYWHKGEDPQGRIDIFKPFGFETLVIWGKELKQVGNLRRKIFDFAESKQQI